MFENVRPNWVALEEHNMTNESVAFPLAQYKTEIEEMPSFMKPIAVSIKDSQEIELPTGLSCFFALVAPSLHIAPCVTTRTCSWFSRRKIPRRQAARGREQNLERSSNPPPN